MFAVSASSLRCARLSMMRVRADRLKSCRAVYVGHGWQRVGVGAKGEQHVRATAAAAKPPCRVVFETHRGDWSELLTLFDLVQADPCAVVEWRGENGPI